MHAVITHTNTHSRFFLFFFQFNMSLLHVINNEQLYIHINTNRQHKQHTIAHAI